MKHSYKHSTTGKRITYFKSDVPRHFHPHVDAKLCSGQTLKPKWKPSYAMSILYMYTVSDVREDSYSDRDRCTYGVM